jgi:CRP-like cAMP-binding protein
MIESNIDQSTWETFVKQATKIKVDAKTILLEEGKISKDAYFIEKGSVRLWFNANGNDTTFQFFFENEAVASIESFMFNKPSSYYIETIEPCVLYKIDKETFNTIIGNSSTEFKEKLNNLLYFRLMHFQRLFLTIISNSPEQRYKKLLKEHPFILNRVPQHYIASYLGITSVSLSRIRNRK